MLVDAEIAVFFSSEVEEVVNIVEFIVCVFDVLLESLQFEIYLETLEAADIAI